MLGRAWIFRATHEPRGLQALRYALVSGTSLLLNATGVYLLADRLGEILELQPPQGLVDKVRSLGKLKSIADSMPKEVSKAACQEIVLTGDDDIREGVEQAQELGVRIILTSKMAKSYLGVPVLLGGEPMAVAGSCTIDGLGGAFIDGIVGDQTWSVSLHAASEVVEMHEAPADALRRKKDSSMRVAINLVKSGVAQACVSAGNTGALMAISRFVLKTLPGIDRPAIASVMPARQRRVVMLDLGANVDCGTAKPALRAADSAHMTRLVMYRSDFSLPGRPDQRRAGAHRPRRAGGRRAPSPARR